jgi:hypothetical protein
VVVTGVGPQGGVGVVDGGVAFADEDALGLFDDDATGEGALELVVDTSGLFEFGRLRREPGGHVGEDLGVGDIGLRPVERLSVIEVEDAAPVVVPTHRHRQHGADPDARWAAPR